MPRHSLLLLLLLSAALPSFTLIIQLDRKASRLAVLLPFTKDSAPTLLESLRRWPAEGDPCPLLRRYEAKHYVDFVFWYHRDFFWEDGGQFSEKFKGDARRELRWMRSCFGRSKFLSAYLVDDGPTDGPSRQFYALYEPKVDGLSGMYDYFFHMPEDVLVVREGWLDALWAHVAFPSEFYIRGSLLRNRHMDSTLRLQGGKADSPVARTLAHINGAALFRLGNSDFAALVRETRAAFDPLQSTNVTRYDAALWEHLVGRSMQAAHWPLYQRYAHQLQHSEFIQNWGEELTAAVLADVRENYTDTFFVRASRNWRGVPPGLAAVSVKPPQPRMPVVASDYADPAADAAAAATAAAVPPPEPLALASPPPAMPPPLRKSVVMLPDNVAVTVRQPIINDAVTDPALMSKAGIGVLRREGDVQSDYFEATFDPELEEEAEYAALKAKVEGRANATKGGGVAKAAAAAEDAPAGKVEAVDEEETTEEESTNEETTEEEEGEGKVEPEAEEAEAINAAEEAQQAAADKAAADAEPAYTDIDAEAAV